VKTITAFWRFWHFGVFWRFLTFFGVFWRFGILAFCDDVVKTITARVFHQRFMYIVLKR
jgi:hypothetical protein